MPKSSKVYDSSYSRTWRKSPTIVTQNANLKVAARRIVFGKLTNGGQTCVAPDYLYVHSSIRDDFVKALKIEIKKQFGDDPSKSKDYTSIVSERHWTRLASFVEQSDVISGGNVEKEKLYIEPTLVDAKDWNCAVMQDEIFTLVLFCTYSRI